MTPPIPAEPPATTTSATSFDETMRRLADIVRRLEAGELTLEESLGAFEQGIVLARDAQRRLNAAEARVDELLAVDAEGRAVSREMRRVRTRSARDWSMVVMPSALPVEIWERIWWSCAVRMRLRMAVVATMISMAG